MPRKVRGKEATAEYVVVSREEWESLSHKLAVFLEKLERLEELERLEGGE